MDARANLQKHPDINKVLVVGPNGNMGKVLIPELLRLGYEVRALQYRSTVEPRDGLEVVHGNTLDRAAIEIAMAGVDAVCHLIRATGPGDTAFEKWFNCAVAGAANLLETAVQVGLKRYISGSADNVFGHVTIPHYDTINENSPKRFADGYYGLFKIVEEAMCRQYFLGFDVPIVIVRFGLTWTQETVDSAAGSLDRKNERIIKRLDRQGQPLVRHDTHVSDAVQGIILSLQHDEAVGEDFNFVAAAPYSATELCAILSSKCDWPVVEQKTDWYSWTISCEKARAVLGYRPQVNVMDLLRAEPIEHWPCVTVDWRHEHHTPLAERAGREGAGVAGA